ncbi:hypothetical protein F4781DRAFT_208163 [Annulohypoxylon bovei var. microspora]|nr:hypothetical protein F4781DRAFT_208163 [Annulohypoxylon bovei var. microspora]
MVCQQLLSYLNPKQSLFQLLDIYTSIVIRESVIFKITMDILIIIISIILLLASIASFIPQYLRIICYRDYAGISPLYVFFNLIVATEQFAIGLQFMVDNTDMANVIVKTPPTVIDWLNLIQFSVVFLCHLVLFGLYLCYPPKSNFKYYMLAIYISFFLISVAPVVLESTLEPAGSYSYRRLLAAVFFVLHTIFINPIITVLAAIAVFPQRHEILSHGEPRALSFVGLAAQAAVFAAVACVWPVRYTVGSDVPLIPWYQLVGWAAVDNLIFAIVQGVLFWTSWREQATTDTTKDINPEETTPLIA